MRADGPTYYQKIPVDVTLKDESILLGRGRVCNHIYNACLRKGIKAVNKLRNDTEYMELARKKEKTKADKDRLSEIRKEKGFTEFSFNNFALEVLRHFPNSIDVHTAQNQARDAFKATEKLLYGKAKKVFFRPADTPVAMISKEPCRGIILNERDMTMNWRGLKLPLRIDRNNPYQAAGFLDKNKYNGIMYERIRGRNRWYALIARKGTPPNMFKRHPDRLGKGNAGMDFSVSTTALASESHVELYSLNPSDRIYPPEGAHLSEKRPWREYHRPKDDAQKKKNLQRKMERSRRANNPQNYNEDGTIKKAPKGKKLVWKETRTYRRTREEFREISRKEAVHREQGHNILAKEILSCGERFIGEPMDYQALQKRAKETTYSKKNGRPNMKGRYGKTISNHAPGLFRHILNRKLGYFGLAIEEVNPFKVKASQFCHLTGKCVKKQLYEQWTIALGILLQRDLYAAFLLMCIAESLDAVDIEECGIRFGRFLELHDKEVERLKKLPKGNELCWYVH